MKHDFPVSAPTRWTLRRAFHKSGASDFRISAEGSRPADGAVASVYVRDGREAVGAAHARLIAAAPELRDALGALVYRLEVTHEATGHHRITVPAGEVAALRALLARIEGGQA